MLKGIPAAPGIAIGKAFLLHTEDINISRQKILAKDVPVEIARFEEALIKTREEIKSIQEKISKEMGSEHGDIFNAHLLVLEDRMIIEEVIERLKRERFKVEYIFIHVLKKYKEVFSKMNDEYLKERSSDIDDVGNRIIRNLLGKQRQALNALKEKVIVVAHDLSPSDTAGMYKSGVSGFVTDIGGRTSHTAIMAKSLEIPAVVGLNEVTRRVKFGDSLIVDGTTGIVLINPTESVIKKYQSEKKKFEAFGKGLLKLKDLPAVTKDGHRVELAANIELPEEIPSVESHGAEGIGLYRTEYFYMNRVDLPTEDEHYEAYKMVAEAASPFPVIIRTLDLGGDKFISQLDIPHEMNPFLGWRAIRFCLARPEVFKVQLRAILRASVHGRLKVMYPMISGVEELRSANKLFEEVKAELIREGIGFDKEIEVGAMIEIPSAALTADLLAKEVDFFSIGTNDLIQYSLAVDRVNEKIAYLYEPLHPAILRLLKNIIDVGHKAGIWVGVCGEMAGEPANSLLLLGLGIDEISTSPLLLPGIKQVIRAVEFREAKTILEQALKFETGKEVENFVRRKLDELMAKTYTAPR